MNTKVITASTIFGLVAMMVILGIGIGVFSTAHTPVAADGMQKGVSQPMNGAVHISGTFVPDSTEQQFGAVSVLQSPLEVDGSQTFIKRLPLRSATSALAVFKSPSASSTIMYAACNVASGNAYLNNIAIGWGPVPNATTTLLAEKMSSATTFAIIATSSLANGTAIAGGVDGVIPGNTFVSVNLGTSTAISNINIAPIGSCTVEFRLI